MEQTKTPQRRLLESAAQQCAPVIFGIKPSNLLIIDKTAAHGLKSLLQATGLKIRCLSPFSSRQVWFLYRESSLAELLKNDTDNMRFIAKYGYCEDLTQDEMLLRLSDHFMSYKRGEAGFPHELGVFLGYPLCDVKGFIENNGKNYLCSGYWKVYANEQEARKTFKRYDHVRRYAISLVRQGVELSGKPGPAFIPAYS